jgi:hypothetical protein
MRSCLTALVLTAAAATAVLPALPASAVGYCTGTVDTNCQYTRCGPNCPGPICRVYVNTSGDPNGASCLQ